MIARAITFPCHDIILEGEMTIPQGEQSSPCVIVCHPHPLYGGAMLNNVVSAICQTLLEHSIAALRFNFRGVGNSGGKHDNGNDERKDVKAALEYLLSIPEIDPNRIGLAGYSFGAAVALSVATDDKRVTQLALVSPPLSDANREQLRDYRNPNITLVGDADNVIQLEQIRQLSRESAEPEQFQLIPGIDHSWQGHEIEAAQRITRFFSKGFNIS